MAERVLYQGKRYRTRNRKRRRRGQQMRMMLAGAMAVLLALTVYWVVGTAWRAIRGQKQLVLQNENSVLLIDGKQYQLGATVIRDSTGALLAPLDGLCEALQLRYAWGQTEGTGVLYDQKDRAVSLLGSAIGQTSVSTLGLSTCIVPQKYGDAWYVRAGELCQMLGWQVSQVQSEAGDMLIITRGKTPLEGNKLDRAQAQAIAVMGPTRTAVLENAVVARVGADAVWAKGETLWLREDQGVVRGAVIEQDGTPWIALSASIEALGGTAAWEQVAGQWQVDFDGRTAMFDARGRGTLTDTDGTHKLDQPLYTDKESGRAYASPALLAALLGRRYTAQEQGVLCFTAQTTEQMTPYADELHAFGLALPALGDIPPADVYLAFTFDDGPTGKLAGTEEGVTADLLNGLAKRGAHATFFMVGSRVAGNEAVVQRMVDEGHELGNHSMNHPMSKLTSLDRQGVVDEIGDATDEIIKATGQAPTVMRPVGGGVNSTVKAVAAEEGLPIINWNVDTEDWRVRDAQSVCDRIVSQAKDGAVILMHDLYPTTVQGALQAIDKLQASKDTTYAFVTVSQLATIKGIALDEGTVYNGLTDVVAQQIQDGTYHPAEFS